MHMSAFGSRADVTFASQNGPLIPHADMQLAAADWCECLFGTGPSRLQSLNGQRHKILIQPLGPSVDVLNDHVSRL